MSQTEARMNEAEKAEIKRARNAKRAEKKRLKKNKKNALVICRDGKEFWTTQDQFWQWTRERVVKVTGHNPLRGDLLITDEEYAVVIANTVLNLKCRNHLSEVMYSRRFRAN